MIRRQYHKPMCQRMLRRQYRMGEHPAQDGLGEVVTSAALERVAQRGQPAQRRHRRGEPAGQPAPATGQPRRELYRVAVVALGGVVGGDMDQPDVGQPAHPGPPARPWR